MRAARQSEGTALFEIFPIAIGYYHSDELPNLEVETQVNRIVDLLAPFGGALRPWSVPVPQRGADSVQQRLLEWRTDYLHQRGPIRDLSSETGIESPPSAPLSSFLYWVGHGWSDGRRSALAHAYSPGVVGANGVSPQDIAYAIAARQALAHLAGDIDEASGWAVIVVDACRSAQIASEILQSALAEHGPPRRVLIVGVSSEGATSLGRFANALGNVLDDTFRTEQVIQLRELATQLERVLGDGVVHPSSLGSSALTRRYLPTAGWSFTPMDTFRHLEQILKDLSPDERAHFMNKATGSEKGELSWFFVGREAEIRTIASWLDNAESGLLIVTGSPGSGKSALLGNVLVQSSPELRQALVRRGLISMSDSVPRPPRDAFDVAIHLSGLTLKQVVARLARAYQLHSLPSELNPSLGVANDIDWVTRELGGLALARGRLTILVDALDEADSPLDTARSLLAPIAKLRGVRLLVGTRMSTQDGPDRPMVDRNLIDALLIARADGLRDDVLHLSHDRTAVSKYVSKRLRHARDYGDDTVTASLMSHVSDRDIASAAAQIADRDRGFLFARLAVYELIEEPSLLLASRTIAFHRLLIGDHQDLFAKAMDRLGRVDDRYPFLMQALSLARGRGLPEADGVWARVTSDLLAGSASVNQTPVMAPISNTEWSDLVHKVLIHASPYIGVDHQLELEPQTAESGTVYRLAHRTFVEYFLRGRSFLRQDVAQDLVARGLLEHARTIAAGRGSLGRYLTKHLSGHISEAGRWTDLADSPDVLDMLDPDAVSADATRTLFGRGKVPAAIAGVVGARSSLIAAALADRPGIRQLAMSVYGGVHRIVEPVGMWGVEAAHVGRESLHITLAGHLSIVNRVCAVPLPDARTGIASASDDGTIRLWDPLSLAPIGAPLMGHLGTVEDVCSFRASDGRLRLASAGSDGTVRIWDPFDSSNVGSPMLGHEGIIWAICGFRQGGRGLHSSNQQSWLASAGADGTVRLWDPESGLQIGEPYRGHNGAVWALCAANVDTTDQQIESQWLASGGVDGRIHFWNPFDGEAFTTELLGAGPIRGLSWIKHDALAGEPAFSGIAAAGSDGNIHVWDLESRQAVRQVLTGHIGAVRSITSLPLRATEPTTPADRPRRLIISAGSDGTLRTSDILSGEPVGRPLSGHVGTVFGVCALDPWGSEENDGQPLIASAGGDSTVRVWDSAPLWSAASASVSDGNVQVENSIYAIASLQSGSDGRDNALPAKIVTGGAAGIISVWDTATGRCELEFVEGHGGSIESLCVRQSGGASVSSARLASGGADGVIQRWTLDGSPVGRPLVGHIGPVHSLCSLTVAATDGSCSMELIISAGGDGTIRAWDFDTGDAVGRAVSAHSGPVWSVSRLRVSVSSAHVATSGADGSIRVWDMISGQAVSPACLGHSGTVNHVNSIAPLHNCGAGSSADVWLASSGADGTIRIWDPYTGREVLQPLKGHTGPVFATCLVKGIQDEGEVLASVGADGSVRLWNLRTGLQIGSPLYGHVGEVHGVCAVFVPFKNVGDQSILATAGDDGSIRLWSPTRGTSVGHPLMPHSVAGFEQAPKAAEDEQYVIRANGALDLWRTDRADLSRVVLFGAISSLVPIHWVREEEELVAVTDNRGRATLRDVSGRVVHECSGLADGPILAAVQLPGASMRIAYGLPSGGIAVWNPMHTAAQPEIVYVTSAHLGMVTSLCILALEDMPLMVSTAEDGIVRLWDSETLAPYGEPLRGHRGRVWSAVSIPQPEGGTALIVTAGADSTVRLWARLDDQFVAYRTLRAHRGEVHALACAISSDGRRVILSGGDDGTLRLWHRRTGELLHTIPVDQSIHALSGAVANRSSHDGSDTVRLAVGTSRGVFTLVLHSTCFPSDS